MKKQSKGGFLGMGKGKSGDDMPTPGSKAKKLPMPKTGKKPQKKAVAKSKVY